nr:hypothetical protein [uncultured Blautia sp.]
MRYKDEIKIGIMTACFCFAMVLVYAVVPKDVSVLKARSTSTFKEAPETAAEAAAEQQSEAEDAGFTIYSQDSNYDYDTSDSSDTSSDTSYTEPDSQDSSGSDSTPDTSYANSGTSSGDYVDEDTGGNDYNPSDQITYPTDDGYDTSEDNSSSGDIQTDYDTGGSDSSSDSGMFEENLVQEETFY